jgi:hypothetical protein
MEAVHTKTLEWEAADTITRLTAEVRVRQTIVEEARDERDAALAEVERLRAVLQRVRQWGSPMIRGYIDGALGRQAGGSDPLADEQVGGVREQEA